MRETGRHWIKLWRKLPKNRQLRKMRVEWRWLYVVLLLMTEDEVGLVAEDGEAFDVDEIAEMANLRREDVGHGIAHLEHLGFIERDDESGSLTVCNFYQFQVSRDAHRKRIQRDHEDKSQDKSLDKCKDNGNESPGQRVANVARMKKQKQKQKKKEIDNPPLVPPGGEKPKKRFIPPTVDEVQAYIDEKGLRVLAAGFIDFYQSKGWLIGKSMMKDWRAACRRAVDWDRNMVHFANQPVDLPSREWVYDTYRREDFEIHNEHQMWELYTEEAAELPRRTVAPFTDWLHGQMGD